VSDHHGREPSLFQRFDQLELLVSVRQKLQIRVKQVAVRRESTRGNAFASSPITCCRPLVGPKQDACWPTAFHVIVVQWGSDVILLAVPRAPAAGQTATPAISPSSSARLHRSDHRSPSLPRRSLGRSCNPDTDHARYGLPIRISHTQPATLADGKQARFSLKMLRSKTHTIEICFLKPSVFFPLAFLRESRSAVTKMSGDDQRPLD
jgi:hypothetical protein